MKFVLFIFFGYSIAWAYALCVGDEMLLSALFYYTPLLIVTLFVFILILKAANISARIFNRLGERKSKETCEKNNSPNGEKHAKDKPIE